MITIVKGDSKIIVTRKQFEDEFKKLGYHELQRTFDKKEVVDKNTTSFKVDKVDKKEKEESSEEKEKEELDKKFGFSNTSKTAKSRKTK